MLDVGSFLSYAEAASFISSKTADCLTSISLGINSDGENTLVTLSANNSVINTLSLAYHTSWSGTLISSDLIRASLTMAASSNLSIIGTIVEGVGFDCSLYTCDGTFIGVKHGDPGETVVFSISTEGIYVIYIGVSPGASDAGANGSFLLSNNISMVANPVVASYDDAGTARQLEACPKMLIPPLTESTGAWYATCADAATVLTDALQVSNCVGHNGFSPTDSFTATDGGTSLSFSLVTPEPQPGVTPIYGSVNAVSGATITVSSSGGQYVGFDIYDDTGTLVESIPATGNTSEVSSALPYTGRYTIVITLNDPGTSPTTWTATITSSGTMSVNPIQALYDTGLTCSARLDCGDSCP